MRVVAKFQLTTTCKYKDVAHRLSNVLNSWSNGTCKATHSGQVITRHSGASSLFTKIVDSHLVQCSDSLKVLELVDGCSRLTAIDVLASYDQTIFRCVLSIDSDDSVSPASIRAPSFIREIVALAVPWTVGKDGERVFANSYLTDVDNLPELEALMASTERRLPIVIVSEQHGQTLGGDLHELLSQDLCGLAHTVRLSQGASWEMTRSRGREWSCYNGAVRLLWPFRANRYVFGAHPIWTFDHIVSRASDEFQARDKIRGIIVDRIIEASTFIADDPEFRDFKDAEVQHAAYKIRSAYAEHRGMQALVEAYAAENDVLR